MAIPDIDRPRPGPDSLADSRYNLLRQAYRDSNSALKRLAPDIYRSIWTERARFNGAVGLVPSESLMAEEVFRGMVILLRQNKYLEGQPGARYYPGVLRWDEMERQAIAGVREVFTLPGVRGGRVVDAIIQPLSGAIANEAVELAIAGVGGKCVGISLAGGGHLSHGAEASATSKMFDFRQITPTPDGNLDYDQAADIIRKHDPALVIIGATSLPRNPNWKLLREIAGDRMLFADIAHTGHLIVTGLLESPVPFVDGFTGTTHKGKRGPKGAYIGITERRGRAQAQDLARRLRRAVFPQIQGGYNALNAPGIAITMRRLQTSEARREGEQTLLNARIMAEAFLRGGMNLLTGGTEVHYITTKFDHIGGEDTTVTGNLIAEAAEAAGFTPNRNGVDGLGDAVLAGGLRVGPVIFTERGGTAVEAAQVGQALVDIIHEAHKVCRDLGISFEAQRDPKIRAEIIQRLEAVPEGRRISRLFTSRHPLPLPI